MGAAARNNPMAQWRKDQAVSQWEIYDQYGRQINVGDVVMWPGIPTITWRITKTRPIMHPQAPTGLVEVTLVAAMVEGMQGGVPTGLLVKVRDAAEYMTPEQIEAMKQGLEVPPAEPPPPGDPPEDAPAEPSRIVLP